MFALRRPTIIPQTTITAVRFTAKTKQKRIPVQLLKNVKGLGIKGEIVQVKPTHMLNWLNFGDKACFILPGQGPRIPVVDRTKQLKKLEEQKRRLLEQERKAQLQQQQDAAMLVDGGKNDLDELKKITGLNFGN